MSFVSRTPTAARRGEWRNKRTIRALFAGAIRGGLLVPATSVPLHGQSGNAIASGGFAVPQTLSPKSDLCNSLHRDELSPRDRRRGGGSQNLLLKRGGVSQSGCGPIITAAPQACSVDRESPSDRTHFFALAAQMMRRILIDHARRRVAGERGGVQQRVNLSSVEESQPAPQSEDVLMLDEALSKLEQADGRAARVVELRFFGGLREQEVADVLGVSVITVKRDWKVARAWLVDQLQSR